MKLGILNEFTGLEQSYIAACKDLGIDYELVDIIACDWIERIKASDCDGFLVRPSFAKDSWKRMYDERIYYINIIMGKPVYPAFRDVFIHESKNNMSYWLETHNIAHAKTWIFYSREQALDFISSKAIFPLIFKPNVGSYSLGVKIITNKAQAKRLANKIFTKYGFFNRGFTKWQRTSYGLSLPVMDDRQYNHMMFQEIINVKHEWRMIKIDESYFGHQKLSNGRFHSGSGLVGWADPPEELLELTRSICTAGKFNALNLDVFENQDGHYYVNEMQPFWAAVDDSQMYIDGKPGRYTFTNHGWRFEEGYFCQNRCCNLKVLNFIHQLEESRTYNLPSLSLG